ncbi:isocitrate dehydrogenase kinase/phosphatase (IDH kinase/phosphatase) (IDHK/P) [Escherichia coli TA464]|nr:isocitrate dehydrogenase kinase/phosphatase (IDH kinase/phosphatase) (IDHK/P) [Escherichia coli TA464]
MLITGAHYKTAYVKGMWKMFMRIGAGSGLAFDSYKSEAKKSAYSTVRQRHFLRRFNHHRAKLGHTVIGNT